MIEILEKAYAKVNFGLKVLPKTKEKEFHNIESIFQTVDLYDEIRITTDDSTSEKNRCFVACDSLILPPKNTLTTAFDSFCDVVDFEVPSVKVHIKKGIPVGGGLGGGSADAAALIRSLEKLCGIKLSEDQQYYIADKTGSDVFFFMNCSDGIGTAKVSGRGEVVQKIKGRTDLSLLMVFPKEGSSTKEAYALVDEMLAKGTEPEAPAFDEYEKIYNQSVESWTFINTFTPVIRDFIPSVGHAIDKLKESESLFADMSGSGSTVYAIYSNRHQAENCMKQFECSFNCKVVQSL